MSKRNKYDSDLDYVKTLLTSNGVSEVVASSQSLSIVNAMYVSQDLEASELKAVISNAFPVYPERDRDVPEEIFHDVFKDKVIFFVRQVLDKLKLSDTKACESLLHIYVSDHMKSRHTTNHRILVRKLINAASPVGKGYDLDAFLNFFLVSKGRYQRIAGELKTTLILLVERRVKAGISKNPNEKEN
jgi:hypothetical protein